MDQARTGAHVAARILLSLIFIVSGFGKLGDVSGFANYMASGGIPAALAWPVVAFEIAAGCALLVGLLTRPVALALAGFTLLTALLYHGNFAEPMQMTQFLKNLAMAGGYLLIALHGPGPLSVDARRDVPAIA